MEMEKIDKDKEEIGMKKQVRRRALTSSNNNKPHKERLMDMAEARREIATALKFHRASINQQQQQQPPTASNQNHNYSAPLLSSAPPIPMGHYHPISPPPPLPLHYEHLNLALPNQTLGLNLNFQGFNNLSTTIYHTPMPVATKESSGGVCSGGGQEKAVNVSGSNHEEEEEENDDDDEYHPFEQFMEFPPWLINANESSCLQDHHFCDEYLPWMDIGEIEGMDGEWLA